MSEYFFENIYLFIYSMPLSFVHLNITIVNSNLELQISIIKNASQKTEKKNGWFINQHKLGTSLNYDFQK